MAGTHMIGYNVTEIIETVVSQTRGHIMKYSTAFILTPTIGECAKFTIEVAYGRQYIFKAEG
jgi:hypothetical protein